MIIVLKRSALSVWAVTVSMQWSKTPTNVYPRYDIKPSDGEDPAFEIWGSGVTSLPLLHGQLWPREVGSDRVLSMGQIA